MAGEAQAVDFGKQPGKAASVKPVPMQVLVTGRLESMRRYEGKVYTHVLTPAPDAYTRPQLVEIRSNKRLGDKHDEVTVTCQLGGYQRKPYHVTDKETGERMTVVPVDHTLDLVETD